MIGTTTLEAPSAGGAAAVAESALPEELTDGVGESGDDDESADGGS